MGLWKTTEKLNYEQTARWIECESLLLSVFRILIWIHRIHMFLGLPDPDTDPPVRGMDPEYSWSFYHQAKTVRKPTVLWLPNFLLVKNDVNVPSKSNTHKTFFYNLFFVGVLNFIDENSRIQVQFRIRIHYSEAWIHGSGSGFAPKCHGSGTLLAILCLDWSKRMHRRCIL